MLTGLILACSSGDPSDPNDPKFDDTNDGDDPVENINADITLTVDATDGIDINPEIFGVNNDWRQIPDNTFSNFATTLGNIGTTVVRYPGGWESEFYAWTSNTTPGWNNTPTQPGASVSTLKSNISNYSVVLPTAEAMNTVVGSSQYNTAIANLKARVKEALTVTNVGNGLVEIGNEWWLQFAGGVSRAQNWTNMFK